ncbi:MAG: penicillin acylase family protein [Actinomycetota bacterium]|nr:penicillin acylase family protein [Actinomycetota bacterium]
MTFEIFRDGHGIPHLRADSVTDLAYAQGLATARDRAWQIELERLRAEGRTAGALGPAGLAWDTFARRALLEETARKCFGRLDTETQAFCTAYVDGVEAGIEEGATRAPEFAALDLAPGRWSPWTPLGIFMVQNILFGTFPTKLWRARLEAALGPEAVELFGAEGAALSGSNAWAVGGRRTASGSPLVGGDPHRLIESPGVYAQVRLACPEFDVVGFVFPGVPGVAHFAHAGEVAWAITNAMADYQDLYTEQIRRRGDVVEALGPYGWEPVESRSESIDVRGEEPVVIEVVVTRNGPVVIGGPDEEAISLRTSTYVARDLGFGAILPLLRAKTVDDVDRAFDAWVEPVNNVVIADRSGSVRYRVAGRVPRRHEDNRRGPVPGWVDDHQWFGWVDLPHTDIPADGHVTSANERRGDESAPIGVSFAPPYRARRLEALLDGRKALTVDDVTALHTDTHLLPAEHWQGLLAKLVDLAEPDAALRDRIVEWDRMMDADSAGAVAFAAWRSAFVRIVASQPVFAPLRGPSAYPALFDPWLNLTARLADALDSFLAAGRPFGLDLPALAGEALAAVAVAGHPSSWGETHVFTPLHGFEQFGVDLAPPAVAAVPLSGDSECVLSTRNVPGITDDCFRGPVARYIWDLSDRDSSRWVVPLGASGVPEDPHHADQLQLWAAGDLIPVVTDWNLLTKESL